MTRVSEIQAQEQAQLQQKKSAMKADERIEVFEGMTIEDVEDPFVYNLKGISWTGKIASSVSDIVESDNSRAIAKAEAEYKQKNAEINAKDEKYQRKLNLLDTEHNAIQTEYESVKSELNKNMERSFKAFQG